MKEIDFAARMQYWRIFYNLTPVCVIVGTCAFFFIGWKTVPLSLLINVLLPFPLMNLSDIAAKRFVASYMGEYYLPVTLEQLIKGELTRAKYLTAKERFSAALKSTNTILTLDPNHAQTLVLKAQILSQGFANYEGAKNCLEKVLLLELPPEEALQQVAEEMLQEVSIHLVNVHREAFENTGTR